MEMGLVKIAGRSELPGRPFLYGTTQTFLEHFGLKHLKELSQMDPSLLRELTTTAGDKKGKQVEAVLESDEATTDTKKRSSR